MEPDGIEEGEEVSDCAGDRVASALAEDEADVLAQALVEGDTLLVGETRGEDVDEELRSEDAVVRLVALVDKVDCDEKETLGETLREMEAVGESDEIAEADGEREMVPLTVLREELVPPSTAVVDAENEVEKDALGQALRLEEVRALSEEMGVALPETEEVPDIVTAEEDDAQIVLESLIVAERVAGGELEAPREVDEETVSECDGLTEVEKVCVMQELSVPEDDGEVGGLTLPKLVGLKDCDVRADGDSAPCCLRGQR
jgi:hypothetical protein